MQVEVILESQFCVLRSIRVTFVDNFVYISNEIVFVFAKAATNSMHTIFLNLLHFTFQPKTRNGKFSVMSH